MADELLRLARESNELRIKLALIEMATELRVVAQHLQRDVLPRGPSHPRRLEVASGRAHAAAVREGLRRFCEA